MNPRFFDMIERAAGRGIMVSTNTNATFLNHRRAQQCVTSGLSEIHISIDGATAETYEAIRVRAHFDRVIANVERLVEARRRLGSATPRSGWWSSRCARTCTSFPTSSGSRTGFGSIPSSSSICATTSANQAFPPNIGRCVTLLTRKPWLTKTRRGWSTTSPRPDGSPSSWASISVCREPSRVNIRLAPLAPAAAHGLGVEHTSAIRAWRCPAAWSPRPTGFSSATWRSRVPSRSGTVQTTRRFVTSCPRRILPRFVALARSIQEPFEVTP